MRDNFPKLNTPRFDVRVADDPLGSLDVEVSARRTAHLAKVAQGSAGEERRSHLRYVIGTEVPVSGGATGHEEAVSVTKVEDARQTVEGTQEAFLIEGLAEAWEKVIVLSSTTYRSYPNEHLSDGTGLKGLALHEFLMERQSLSHLFIHRGPDRIVDRYE